MEYETQQYDHWSQQETRLPHGRLNPFLSQCVILSGSMIFVHCIVLQLRNLRLFSLTGALGTRCFFRYFSLWILMQLDGMASPRVRTIWTQSPGPFDYAPGRQMNDCSRISNWRDPPLFMASGLLAFIIGSEVRIFSNESTPTCLSSARFFFLGPSLHWTNDDSLFSLFFSKSIL